MGALELEGPPGMEELGLPACSQDVMELNGPREGEQLSKLKTVQNVPFFISLLPNKSCAGGFSS